MENVCQHRYVHCIPRDGNVQVKRTHTHRILCTHKDPPLCVVSLEYFLLLIRKYVAGWAHQPHFPQQDRADRGREPTRTGIYRRIRIHTDPRCALLARTSIPAVHPAVNPPGEPRPEASNVAPGGCGGGHLGDVSARRARRDADSGGGAGAALVAARPALRPRGQPTLAPARGRWRPRPREGAAAGGRLRRCGAGCSGAAHTRFRLAASCACDGGGGYGSSGTYGSLLRILCVISAVNPLSHSGRGRGL